MHDPVKAIVMQFRY